METSVNFQSWISVVFFQGILHHVSVLEEKKEEAENAAKQNKVT